jgi:hypothetical protein
MPHRSQTLTWVARDQGRGLLPATGLLGTGQRQFGEMARCTASDDIRCFHSPATDSSVCTANHLVGAVGGLVLSGPAQNNQWTLPAVLRIRTVALSRALVAGSTSRNYRCRALRYSSQGPLEAAAST